MRRALELAAGVRTVTSPNPWVGSVVEPGGFEGATSPPGGPHAESHALQAAGEAARGATIYATLEPCSHTGRTPPCVDQIIDAGIARVVVGVEDPDERVRGRGIRALRAAGIRVDVGVCAEDVRAQLAPYLK
ncbi:MAG: bifunctional diaminohydroxyphosphoribosylaminopyrimidine deaminase/5-amino-6-(5-phosphoribosylamino)uracil reductase RibD, partial [Actinomycetota bacterium]|nr:bifunctional diaminohydroxyphosphoribosylaminopyrimidine deaminase/5-amino-6-(5-phosphoribosylamino)uracil reductase RibD [Actinomycetota bacterium]